MDRGEFAALRQGLQKTQKEMSQLLGTSLRSVQSFEQGWRKVPGHIERQMLFLLAMKKGVKDLRPCWEIQTCCLENREKCPAWEFQVGHLCWFMTGTRCQGKVYGTWARKIKRCRGCKVFGANVKS